MINTVFQSTSTERWPPDIDDVGPALRAFRKAFDQSRRAAGQRGKPTSRVPRRPDALGILVLELIREALKKGVPPRRDLVSHLHREAARQLSRRAIRDPELQQKLSRKRQPITRRYVDMLLKEVERDYPATDLAEAIKMACAARIEKER